MLFYTLDVSIFSVTIITVRRVHMYRNDILEYAKDHPVFLIGELQDHCGVVDLRAKASLNTELARMTKEG